MGNISNYNIVVLEYDTVEGTLNITPREMFDNWHNVIYTTRVTLGTLTENAVANRVIFDHFEYNSVNYSLTGGDFVFTAESPDSLFYNAD